MWSITRLPSSSPLSVRSAWSAGSKALSTDHPPKLSSSPQKWQVCFVAKMRLLFPEKSFPQTRRFQTILYPHSWDLEKGKMEQTHEDFRALVGMRGSRVGSFEFFPEFRLCSLPFVWCELVSLQLWCSKGWVITKTDTEKSLPIVSLHQPYMQEIFLAWIDVSKAPCRCTDRACQWIYLSVLPCSPVRWSAVKIKINARRRGNTGKRSWWARLWSLVDSTGTASSISSVHRGSTWFSSPAGRAARDWLCAALWTATSFWICGGFKPSPGRRPNHPSASFLASDKNLQSISADLNLDSCSSWPSQVGKNCCSWFHQTWSRSPLEVMLLPLTCSEGLGHRHMQAKNLESDLGCHHQLASMRLQKIRVHRAHRKVHGANSAATTWRVAPTFCPYGKAGSCGVFSLQVICPEKVVKKLSCS